MLIPKTKYLMYLMINSLSVPVKSRNWLFQDLDFPFALFRISKGEVTNLEIPVGFLKKYVIYHNFFSGIGQFTGKQFLMNFFYSNI